MHALGVLKPYPPQRFGGPALAALAALLGTLAVAFTARPQYLVSAASFGPGAALVAAALYSEARQRPFSLHLMHLLFVAMFFVTAPLVQSLEGIFPVLDVAPFAVTPDHVFAANAAVILWLACYLLAYSRAKRRPPPERSTVPSRPGAAWPLLSAAGALGVLASLGTFGVVTRSGFQAALASQVPDSSVALIVGSFVRAIPVGSMAILLLGRTYRTLSGAIAFGALVIAYLLLNNPLAAARFSTAAVFIGFVSITVLRKRRTGTLLVGALLAGNLVLMPLLNVGRYAETGTEFLEGVIRDGANSGLNRMASGDFDAYAMLVSAQQYTKDMGVTLGRQLLGVGLFWVPRSWWPSKPIGSGHEIASHYHYPNENLSCPLPAEGLMNFGVVGLAAFAAAWGAGLRKMDDAYWKAPGPMSSRLQVVYPFLLGAIFFVSRGDLLSGFAYTVGVTLGLVVPTVMCTRQPGDGGSSGRRVASGAGNESGRRS